MPFGFRRPAKTSLPSLVAGITVLVAAAGLSLLTFDSGTLEQDVLRLLGVDVVDCQTPAAQPSADEGTILVVQPSRLPLAMEEILVVQPRS